MKALITLLACSCVLGAQPQKKNPPAAAPAQHPTAIIHTSAGDLKCELFPDKAPNAVANFIGLSTGSKSWTDPRTGQPVHDRALYDGVIFHRVIPGFMIQGGDPTGTGSGNVGIRFDDELHPDLIYDKPGRLAMANSGPNTNGSQFFITEQEQPGLNPCFDKGGCQRGSRSVPYGSGYTIFGQCDDHTVELVKQIARMPRGARDRPTEPVRIEHIDIIGLPAKPKPGAKTGTRKAGTKSGAKTKPGAAPPPK